jgi:hypothetical protein
LNEEIDVRNGTDGSHGDGPEYDQSYHEGYCRTISYDPFPPLNAQVRPDYLIGIQANVPRAHVHRQVVGDWKSEVSGKFIIWR